MRILATAVVVCVLAVPAFAGEAVTLSVPSPEHIISPRDTLKVSVVTTASSNSDERAKPARRSESYTITVSKAADGAFTKAKVAYGAITTRGTWPTASSSAYADHTYVLSFGGQDWGFGGEDWGLLDDPQQKALLALHASLGGRLPLAGVLAGRTFTAGTKVTLTADQADELYLGLDRDSSGEAVIILAADAGSFTFSQKLTIDLADGTEVSGPVKGSIWLDLDNATASTVTLEGDLSGTRSDGTLAELHLVQKSTFTFQK